MKFANAVRTGVFVIRMVGRQLFRFIVAVICRLFCCAALPVISD